VQSASDVSSSLAPRTAEMSADIYGLIVREIPQLQHVIELENVHAPAAAEEYARRLVQRGVPASALLP
jgi:hypothetical protein